MSGSPKSKAAAAADTTAPADQAGADQATATQQAADAGAADQTATTVEGGAADTSGASTEGADVTVTTSDASETVSSSEASGFLALIDKTIAGLESDGDSANAALLTTVHNALIDVRRCCLSARDAATGPARELINGICNGL
ncbi:hypothetical protein [uncultured Alsobacter sp.]|uniref:hypothetical protein n=1 Tax=uncultured Alsobacter sp. TaxID=1748258 RepID=UPI0025EC595B|nr:hypothetical protein [uncultured Alsobacter sp.]